MQRLFSVSIFTLLLLIFMTSCKKNKNAGSVSFQLRSQNQSSVVAGRIQSGALTWNSGYVFVDKVEFEAEKNDDFEIQIESRIRRRIDLFGSISQISTIQLEPGKYEEVEVELDLISTATDTAFVLRGSYANNAGATIPVVFVIRDTMELEAEAENVVLTGVDDYRFLTTFDLSKLTIGITQTLLNSATLTNGVLVISATSNSSLYSILLSNINKMDGVELDD